MVDAYAPVMDALDRDIEEVEQEVFSEYEMKPEEFVDMTFVKELDESGFIDSLYK